MSGEKGVYTGEENIEVENEVEELNDDPEGVMIGCTTFCLLEVRFGKEAGTFAAEEDADV